LPNNLTATLLPGTFLVSLPLVKHFNIARSLSEPCHCGTRAMLKNQGRNVRKRGSIFVKSLIMEHKQPARSVGNGERPWIASICTSQITCHLTLNCFACSQFLNCKLFNSDLSDWDVPGYRMQRQCSVKRAWLIRTFVRGVPVLLKMLRWLTCSAGRIARNKAIPPRMTLREAHFAQNAGKTGRVLKYSSSREEQHLI
jgi:hypothetical protein